VKADSGDRRSAELVAESLLNGVCVHAAGTVCHSVAGHRCECSVARLHEKGAPSGLQIAIVTTMYLIENLTDLRRRVFEKRVRSGWGFGNRHLVRYR
jgi:hypothetical protein